MDFIAFDLETTGTVPAVDQIVEIGAVRYINNQIESVFSTLIDPKRPIPSGASAVNGIFDEMVRGKPVIEDILRPFSEFCQDMPLVAHNAQFDTQFLISSIKKFETPAPRGVVLDTLPMARKVLPGLANYKLGTLVQHLKVAKSGDYHRAEQDASYCGSVFIELVKRVSINGQAPKIENLITLTGKTELRFPQIVRQPKQLEFIL